MKVSHEFRKEVMKFFEESKLNMCYQCGKCSSFCPVFWQHPEKFNPRKIIEMASIGIEDIIKKPDIWRCTTCYECVENCPQRVSFVELIYALRNLSIKKGFAPKEALDEFESIKKYGFIMTATDRIKKIRQSLGIDSEIEDKKEIIEKILAKTGGEK